MFVRKITTGFVTQLFDTETGKWVAQDFTCGDECTYEDNMGNTVDPSEVLPTPEPYLPFDMVQP